MVPNCSMLVFMYQPCFTSLPHMWTLPNPNTHGAHRAHHAHVKAAKKFKIVGGPRRLGWTTRKFEALFRPNLGQGPPEEAPDSGGRRDPPGLGAGVVLPAPGWASRVLS